MGRVLLCGLTVTGGAGLLIGKLKIPLNTALETDTSFKLSSLDLNRENINRKWVFCETGSEHRQKACCENYHNVLVDVDLVDLVEVDVIILKHDKYLGRKSFQNIPVVTEQYLYKMKENGLYILLFVFLNLHFKE